MKTSCLCLFFIYIYTYTTTVLGDVEYQMKEQKVKTVPNISSKSSVKRVKLNDEVTLPCSVENLDPNLAVMWFSGKNELISSDTISYQPDIYRITAVRTGIDFSLTFKVTKKELYGYYYCTTSYGKGSLPLKHVVLPLAPGENDGVTDVKQIKNLPKFVSEPSKHSAEIKEMVTLECAIDKPKPKLAVIWKQGENMLTADDVSTETNFTVASNKQDTSFSLTFKVLSKKFYGTYECTLNHPEAAVQKHIVMPPDVTTTVEMNSEKPVKVTEKPDTMKPGTEKGNVELPKKDDEKDKAIDTNENKPSSAGSISDDASGSASQSSMEKTLMLFLLSIFLLKLHENC